MGLKLFTPAVASGPNPQRVQEATAQSTTTSVAVTLPQAPVTGHLLLAFVSFQETVASGGGPTLPSGWTQIGSTLNYNGAVSINYLAVYYLVVPSTPATSYTFDATAGSGATVGGMNACVVEYSQVYTASPVDVFTSSGGSSVSPSYPTLTTTRDNDTLIGATSFDGRNSSGGITYTGPANWLTYGADTGSTTTPIAGGQSDTPFLTAGATTSVTATLSTSTPWGTFVIALASLTGSKTYLQTLSGTNTTSGAFRKRVGVILQAVNVTASSFKRKVSLILQAVNTTSATTKAILVYLVKLVATNTTSATFRKSYGKFLRAVNTTSAGFKKRIGLLLTAVNTTAASVTTPGSKLVKTLQAINTTVAKMFTTLIYSRSTTLYIDTLNLGGPQATNIMRMYGQVFDLQSFVPKSNQLVVSVRVIATGQPYTTPVLSGTLNLGSLAIPLTASPTGYAFTGTLPPVAPGVYNVSVSFLATTPVKGFYQTPVTPILIEGA